MKLLTIGTVSVLSLSLTSLSSALTTYKLTDLGFPGSISNLCINNAGQIGIGTDAATSDAYLYSGGTFTNLNPSSTSTTVAGISSTGAVAGTVRTGSSVRATIFAGGTATDISGGLDTTASGMSDNGKVVGTANGNGAFYYDGTLHLLPAFPASQTTHATAVNDSGVVVGSAQLAAKPYNGRGYVYSGGVMTDLGDLPGASFLLPSAINNSGTIVGRSDRADGTSLGFYYSGGTAHALGELNVGRGGWASDVNDYGQIIGSAMVASGPCAVVYDHGTPINLNQRLSPTVTGWFLRYAYSINNSGQIVGLGQFGGQWRSFLLTPNAVPEPSTWAALGLGAAAMLRRRKKA